MSRWKQIEMFLKMEFSAGHCRPDDGCASTKECHALKRNPHPPSGAHSTENYQPGWPLACPDYLQYGRRWGLVYRGPKMGNRKRTWTGKEQGRGASAARVSAAIAAMGSPPPGEKCGAGDDSPAEDREGQCQWYICCCSRTRLQLLRVCWADQGHLDL
jgi:hypothetical protein